MQMVLLPARINDCCFKSEANLKANYLCHNCLSVILKQLLCKRYCNLPFLPTLSIFNRYLSAVSLPAIKFSLNLASGVSFVLSLSLRLLSLARCFLSLSASLPPLSQISPQSTISRQQPSPSSVCSSWSLAPSVSSSLSGRAGTTCSGPLGCSSPSQVRCSCIADVALNIWKCSINLIPLSCWVSPPANPVSLFPHTGLCIFISVEVMRQSVKRMIDSDETIWIEYYYSWSFTCACASFTLLILSGVALLLISMPHMPRNPWETCMDAEPDTLD